MSTFSTLFGISGIGCDENAPTTHGFPSFVPSNSTRNGPLFDNFFKSGKTS